jgi:hypothetical protein
MHQLTMDEIFEKAAVEECDNGCNCFDPKCHAHVPFDLGKGTNRPEKRCQPADLTAPVLYQSVQLLSIAGALAGYNESALCQPQKFKHNQTLIRAR